MAQQATAGTPTATQAPATGTPVVVIPQGNPRAVYQALREKREVLGDQMSRLLNRRDNISERMQSTQLSGAERGALEEHMKEITGRIIDMEKQLHAADAEVSAAAGVPGAALPDRQEQGQMGPIDEDIIGVAVVFSGIALIIISIAYARRLWKGASAAVAQFPDGLLQRFTRMEEAIDTVAIEVERVSEGQRFLGKLFAEQRSLGGGGAQPIEQREKVAEPVRRG